MRRAFWFLLGVAVGTYASVRIRRAVREMAEDLSVRSVASSLFGLARAAVRGAVSFANQAARNLFARGGGEQPSAR